jgi:hypothetical protein
LVITGADQFVYTSNAGSANVSGFSLSGGFLTALPGTIVGSNPVALRISEREVEGIEVPDYRGHFIFGEEDLSLRNKIEKLCPPSF